MIGHRLTQGVHGSLQMLRGTQVWRAQQQPVAVLAVHWVRECRRAL